MCRQCNYKQFLSDANLEATSHRLRVLEIVGNNSYPIAAADICKTLQRNHSINRVTVYRILDLLVQHGVVDRISSGGRAFFYDLAPNEHHRQHPHFYCTSCGQMDCLLPDSIVVDTGQLWKSYPGRIEKVQVRIDGICNKCETDAAKQKQRSKTVMK